MGIFTALFLITFVVGLAVLIGTAVFGWSEVSFLYAAGALTRAKALAAYIKVPPNLDAVFTGRGKTKVVRGGARLKIPGLERVDFMFPEFMFPEPFNVNINLLTALSNDGVPVNVEAVGLVRIVEVKRDAQIAAANKQQAGEAEADSRKDAGKTQIAEAFNAFTSQAAQQQNLPAVLAALVDATSATAQPIGEIDRISIVGGADSTGLLNGLGSGGNGKALEPQHG